ncbi:flagellar export chaperone FliS [Aestuariirhabdus litorea]|uniref:Flagellar secretion chaperone FliS n=1 Tax=Aestuariirhabdus litorea TaxID=2528527 RepID=A0A3P3VU71_9GAMM|nr:flagellar export chaperone FliS [Aestuariirhabdus litorea]RRJ84999.1 flagella export chaperone FliS [Aestuariirhabdus litorea]RWW98224.1 flagellar export chaperone FliS [Endozoicomonadaceae bacterium GTF-13]
MNSAAAIQSYKNVRTQTGVTDASPHRLIQMLMEGCLESLAKAKGAIARNDDALRSEMLSKAIAIVGGLQIVLDFEKGGEIAENLNALYHYMTKRLFEANQESDPEIINEVARLMINIKEGWDGIADQVD